MGVALHRHSQSVESRGHLFPEQDLNMAVLFSVSPIFNNIAPFCGRTEILKMLRVDPATPSEYVSRRIEREAANRIARLHP